MRGFVALALWLSAASAAPPRFRPILRQLRAATLPLARQPLSEAEQVQLVQYARKARLRGIDIEEDTRVSPHATNREITRVFHKFDLDRNGEVSQPEFLAVMLTAGKQRRQAEAEFSRFDANGDGTISYDEFARSTVRMARRRQLRRRLLAEAIGSAFIAWFAGIASVAKASIGGFASASMMGMAVASAVYATRRYSGAHLNPAFTAAFVATGTFRPRDMPGYVLAQLVGATLAASAGHVALVVAPAARSLAVTTVRPSLAVEVLASFFLVLLVFMVGDEVRRGRLQASLAPMVIGGVVTLITVASANLGVCLNPAVGLGAMIISAVSGLTTPFAGVWVSIFGPLIGAMLAIPVFVRLETTRDSIFGGNAGERRRRMIAMRKFRRS